MTEVALDDPRNTRPHQVIFGERIAEAIYAAIHDPQLLALIPFAGSVSQMMAPSGGAVQNVAFCRSLVNNLKRNKT